ncbi:MAG: SDR family NAD(P)-dependent oxidoreductase [Devosiaceae bacterium]|nr:SDR family NAD(P)-dependent oxidoreductase [Devosiaceae bacterium MH13]
MANPEQFGPWAVVTGASSGIGRSMAELLAAKGFNLVLIARREQVLDELAGTLGGAHGIETKVLATDLSDSGAVKACLSATEGLDVGLLVAASGFGAAGPFVDEDPELALEMIDVNIAAVVAMARHFAPRFAAKARGGIVLFGSIVGGQGVPGSANYAATKGYIHSFGEALAREMRPLGVSVLVSAPGPVATEFGGRAGMTYGFSATADQVAEQTLAALGRRSYIAPTAFNRFLQTSLAFLPRFGRVRVMERIMAGMTAG